MTRRRWDGVLAAAAVVNAGFAVYWMSQGRPGWAMFNYLGACAALYGNRYLERLWDAIKATIGAGIEGVGRLLRLP